MVGSVSSAVSAAVAVEGNIAAAPPAANPLSTLRLSVLNCSIVAGI